MEGEPRGLVVITGASRGIGRATALALAPHFDLLGGFVDSKKESRTVETIRDANALGAEMEFVQADITEEGNYSSGSVFKLLQRGIEVDKSIKQGSQVIVIGFGAGMIITGIGAKVG